MADQNIVQVTNAKDSAALMKLLSPEIMIICPANTIINRLVMVKKSLESETTSSRYLSFSEVFFLFVKDVAIIMGKEVLVPAVRAFWRQRVNSTFHVMQRIGDGWMHSARPETYKPEKENSRKRRISARNV